MLGQCNPGFYSGSDGTSTCTRVRKTLCGCMLDACVHVFGVRHVLRVSPDVRGWMHRINACARIITLLHIWRVPSFCSSDRGLYDAVRGWKEGNIFGLFFVLHGTLSSCSMG